MLLERFLLVHLVYLMQDAYGTAIVGCPDFRYMNTGSCHPCPENCRKCITDTNCTQCQKGFYGQICENRCGGGCTGTCHKVYGHCTYGCPDGEYPAENNRCRPCPDYCHLCESESKCILCEDGKFGDACQEACPEGCNRCDKNTGQCLQCKTSYFFLDEQCQSCPNGCKLCVAESNCTQCTDSHYLQDQHCMSCPHGCSRCNSTDYCRSCDDQFVGPINGRCLFKCLTSVVNVYIVPDKTGRCGVWQDTNTNICNGTTKSHSCTSSGYCLQNASCSCRAENSCNVDGAEQSLCAAIMRYGCSHKCQMVFGIFVCKATCSLRGVDKDAIPLRLTQEKLSIVAMTWNGTEKAFCLDEQGAVQASLDGATFLTGGTIAISILFVNVIITMITMR